MKKIISYFIKFSVAVNVTILAFIVFGFAGVLSMKSSFFPLTDSQNISINLTYPGASPQEMEEGIVSVDGFYFSPLLKFHRNQFRQFQSESGGRY